MGIYPSPGPLVTPLVGVSSVAVAGANLSRLGLYVFNPSSTVTLWVSPTGISAAVNGAGSVAVQPLQGVVLGAPNMPPWTAGLNAVASAGGSNPITVLEFVP
jgi:hypothetical protein